MAADWLNPRVKGKEKATDEKEELFVFGYACKLFRDDERALSIDKGSHLIPWMGDDKLLIDRYDGRGHLYDLKPYDSSHAQPCELTAEEEKLEELCNEERYLELHTDVAEKKLYEEEEWKRYYQSLSEGYGAVGFSYDYHSHQHNSEYYQANAEEEKPFEVPPELNLPDDITPPDTEKSNAIIEKTAKFVAKQGAQMEILIKTKQANNPQFEFLHFENPLNLYYKHMVKMIKSGKYKPKEEAVEEEDPDNEDDDEGHGYLHPSLMVTRKASPAPEVPAYKPLEMPKVSVHDTPYGQLIKSLAKKQQPDATEDVNQVSDYQDEIKPLKPPPLPPFYQDAGYSGNHHAHPPPPGIEPVTLPSRLQTEPPPPGTDVEGQMLAHRQTQHVMDDYQTQAQSRASPGPFDHIVPPPPDIQPVIDRMAMYVAKNGIEFEIVVKSKNDPRFQFLLPHHVHFPYYDFKKQIHMREAAKDRGREMRDVEKPTAKLSFSIKPKAKEENKRKEKKKKKVFDNESSENDADSDREKSSASGTSTPVGSDYTEEKPEKPQVPQEERDRKIAEDRLRDKMAHAAREKLAQTSREKQMQAERKRKAAMFINMLRSCNPGAAGDEEKLEEEFLNAKDSEKSTPVPTPGCSPYYGPLEKDKCEEVIAKKPKKSKHKDRSKRSRSRSPRRRRRQSRSPSPVRKLNRSHSPKRSLSPSRRRSRSPARRRSRSPAHRGSGRDRHSSSKKSKKRRRSRTSSRSPKPKSNPEQPVSIDLTVDDSPEQPSVTNGDESSYSLSQYNLEQNQRMYDQREPSSDRLTPSLDADDSNSNASDSRSVSSYMRERVRAIIKASRKAIMEEEGPLYDDT